MTKPAEVHTICCIRAVLNHLLNSLRGDMHRSIHCVAVPFLIVHMCSFNTRCKLLDRHAICIKLIAVNGVAIGEWQLCDSLNCIAKPRITFPCHRCCCQLCSFNTRCKLLDRHAICVRLLGVNGVTIGEWQLCNSLNCIAKPWVTFDHNVSMQLFQSVIIHDHSAGFRFFLNRSKHRSNYGTVSSLFFVAVNIWFLFGRCSI